ncbi:hypothetical protein PsorP6_005140 [Peronosclerospora sorghi]|uniref:Uncharacterized protein n=1 Tax=Peronosclerospora sorghi TaxID=230839 RepID=A0ACC0W3P4_9STRA|nr:hypothetical protein PsorP6_005140 [Peronosclerospora sorghi]
MILCVTIARDLQTVLAGANLLQTIIPEMKAADNEALAAALVLASYGGVRDVRWTFRASKRLYALFIGKNALT